MTGIWNDEMIGIDRCSWNDEMVGTWNICIYIYTLLHIHCYIYIVTYTSMYRNTYRYRWNMMKSMWYVYNIGLSISVSIYQPFG